MTSYTFFSDTTKKIKTNVAIQNNTANNTLIIFKNQIKNMNWDVGDSIVGQWDTLYNINGIIGIRIPI